MTLLHDGSWPGFLTAMFDAHAAHPPPEDIRESAPEQLDLLSAFVHVHTSDEKACRVLRGVREKLPVQAMDTLEALYRRGDEGADFLAFRYLKRGWEYRLDLCDHLEDPVVFEAMLQTKRVYGEAHKMLGLLRFASTATGAMYAPMHTDNDILDLLADHFVDRFRTEPFLIHDVGRGKAAAYDGHALAYAPAPRREAEVGNDEMEPVIAELWRTYHRTIAIAERVNPRLQAQFMPRRYWRHLTEFAKP